MCICFYACMFLFLLSCRPWDMRMRSTPCIQEGTRVLRYIKCARTMHARAPADTLHAFAGMHVYITDRCGSNRLK